jgi:hypothetical protein
MVNELLRQGNKVWKKTNVEMVYLDTYRGGR